MRRHDTYFFCLSILLLHNTSTNVDALACNWGTQASHPIPPNIVVKLLRDNGFNKVKLFEADPGALRALGKSGIQVMVGIPNDLLATMASTVTAAELWVQQNVSQYISKYGTDIRHVAVGNEPFLKTYKDRFVRSTYPALKNVQAALVKAGLGRQVKVTVPLNADVYDSGDGLPSSGDFRSDIKTLMVSIVRFLADSVSPITFNIYPFLSQRRSELPREYAFFPGGGGGGGGAKPVVDGSISYTTSSTRTSTLLSRRWRKRVRCEQGGDHRRRSRVAHRRRYKRDSGDGSEIQPGVAQPHRSRTRNAAPENGAGSLHILAGGRRHQERRSGKFERHWGIFSYDGSVKYPLSLGNGRRRRERWLWTSSADYACQLADCTLGPGSSCAALDSAANASYAFNMYFQKMDHRRGACVFDNLGFVTKIDPSRGSCRFPIEIDTSRHETLRPPPPPPRSSGATGIKWRTVAAAAMAVGWAVFN
ncbi:hypothetical protein Bca52824_051274 [Brassica carinata]|uniref:glucan endo-1,3-beta-D-glucosidase n=1 Tax=Brassica carinata TaxID=52824 RepID=A0A8X7R028_BRACI|nr:hypothetical protein Bca52824_051274 [Brassica carinata]